MSSPEPSRPVSVLVVDDSAVTCSVLKRLIESDSMLRVVGRAGDGVEALEKIAALQPHVVTLDFEMPRLNGLDTLRRIMREMPRPVLMVSRFTQQGAAVTLQALELGAFDYIPKPHLASPHELGCVRDEIVAKIKAAASAGHRLQPQWRPAAAATPLCRGPNAG
jgi:two-component system chemotaxis response regulator CheB